MSTTAPASVSPMPPGVTDPNYKPLPGRLGNLTIPQQHALEKLKKELQEEDKYVSERMDDATLLRYVFVVVFFFFHFRFRFFSFAVLEGRMC